VATGEDMVFESMMRALSQGRNYARDRKNDTIFFAGSPRSAQAVALGWSKRSPSGGSVHI
jgi:hypothetical protein